MSNYIEYNDKVAFHPGYYIKELVEESGMTQEDFAKRLDTTPKNLSVLIKGEQSLSLDIAMKLSRMIGTSVNYWLNLQMTYDALVAEFKSAEVMKQEREVFKYIDYSYFKNNFGLPDLSRKINEQIKAVREFLGISTLQVLTEKNLAVSFRSYAENLSVSNIVNANVMVQIAINKTLQTEAPKYDGKKFSDAISEALTLTSDHQNFLPRIKESFKQAGVVLVVLPNLKNSGINGATKKVGKKMMLMVNDRRYYADTFWFSLLHEAGHIIHGDFQITFSGENEKAEDIADSYARDLLIPPESYETFKAENSFDEDSIRRFAASINRDPGIVYGRLQKDQKVPFHETALSKKLRHKYKIVTM